ncbi:hypothetical protein EDB81DRAFT_907168 [Dactylonectria macrodidyma]|uniref:FAD-binding domain-containing protein n=1 Tax=Dactylonectria macrodidyma TaxID=307937 RepID=A0A9P9INL1_9HYPO|nr:hypothetical protein EDB81DRAFT_907168 [Dactylonectria macrodidyma]
MANSSKRLQIVICGGGIAGFATALLLREDHDVLILEASELNQELGAAITLSMNASRLLCSSYLRAGLDPVRARYVEAEKLQELDWKTLGVHKDIPNAPLVEKYGAPWWYFSRQDIHQELKRAALSSDGLGSVPKLELGAKVCRVDLDSMAVHVQDGRSFKGDLIIAADGIRTVAGTSVFGRLPTVNTGFSAYRCMVPSQRLRDDPDTGPLLDCAKVLMIMHPERRIVIYPCSSWETMNFVCVFPDDEDRRQQWTKEVSVDELVKEFSDFHPAVVKMLSMAEDPGVWQLRDRDPLPTLVKGRFCMIGDAAHAMGPHQGQGACQAIEDAEALRVILKDARVDDLKKRLVIYDDLRVERVRRVIENTRTMGPKRVGDDSRLTDQQYSQYSVVFADYHWGYKMTAEAVKAMNQGGIVAELLDAATGEIVVRHG